MQNELLDAGEIKFSVKKIVTVLYVLLLFAITTVVTVMVLLSVNLVQLAHSHFQCVDGHSNNGKLHIVRCSVEAVEGPLTPPFTQVHSKECGNLVMFKSIAGKTSGIVPVATNGSEFLSHGSPDKVARYQVVVSERNVKSIELVIGGNGSHQLEWKLRVVLHTVEDLKKNYKKGETMEEEDRILVT